MIPRPPRTTRTHTLFPDTTRFRSHPTPEIAGPLPEFAVDATTLPTGLDRHPTIRMIDAQAGQADADVRVAEAGRRSDFGVNLAYQRRDPRFGDYVSAGVTVSLPFFTRNRQNAGIAAAQANAARILAESEAARRALPAHPHAHPIGTTTRK